MLLASPSLRRLPRASVLLCVLLAVLSVSLPASARCPVLQCAQDGRQLCRVGSSHCGPCLDPLQENDQGHCVLKKRHRYNNHGKVPARVDLDEEIDYLQTVIAKQELSKQEDAPVQRQRSQGRQSTSPLSSTNTTTNISTTTAAAATPASAPASATVPPHHPDPPTPLPRASGAQNRAGPVPIPIDGKDSLLIIMISLCILVGTIAIIMAAVCWVRLQKEQRLAQKIDYPAYGGAGKTPPTVNGTMNGDKTLAQNAQMYHYQHQKQQMISIGKNKPEQKVPETEVTSDEEEVGGDFTVYECPGLAPTGEMEVKNPLFDDTTLRYQGNHQ